tara:strand:- start:603 stop:776 length:174 start_codon:yes stop_codon:yes gene_type:complete
MQPGDLVKRKNQKYYGLIVSRNKAKKTWHKKITIMWSSGCIEIVPLQFATKEYLEKI